jgi:hypothetical protein
MTFITRSKRTLRGSALAAALILTAGALAACGGDDEDTGAADVQDIVDQATADADDSLVGSEALQAMQAKAEEYGYKDCMMSPPSVDDLSTVRLSCVETGLPQLSIFDRDDRESGSEVVEAELDKVMDASGGLEGTLPREEMGSTYRALDGDDVVGSCQDFGDACDEVAEALGLKATMPEGALTGKELEKKREDDMARDAREAERKRQEEEKQRQRELQTYSGWDDLDEATEQLGAWDISCREGTGSNGKAAWCRLDSALVTFDISADELEKKDVFREVARDEMVSVSDGDWRVICAPGAEDICETVADKTGKPVKDGV